MKCKAASGRTPSEAASMLTGFNTPKDRLKALQAIYTDANKNNYEHSQTIKALDKRT